MAAPAVCRLIFLLCAIRPACAGDATTVYPVMAPIERYRMPTAADEITLSRSAAPASISGNAGILVLGAHGYELALKGSNGFVCLVQRSWASGFDDAEFWNPDLRGPICFNDAAARTILPAYLERTGWVISGASKAELINRTKAGIAATAVAMPAPGALAYMMSKQQYLGDHAGHWHPHLMFFFGRADVADWGADLPGAPVFSSAGSDLEPVTTFFVLVPAWSDGTSAAIETHQH